MANLDKNKQKSKQGQNNRANYWAWKLTGRCVGCGIERNGHGVRCAKCAKRWAEYHRRDRLQAWDKILAHYGALCACCGETNRLFLTIDHINNDGYLQRMVPWTVVRKRALGEGWPTDIRILCYNCNCGRARNGGVCPHEQEKQKAVG